MITFTLKMAAAVIAHPEVFLTGVAVGYLAPGSIPIATARAYLASAAGKAADAGKALFAKFKK